jgi:hypothetical protein
MARPIEKQLSKALRDSDLFFVERGEWKTHEIYDFVKRRYPTLCDDEYHCIDNCSGGSKQPEWNHLVRRVLNSLKSENGSIRHFRQGYWEFC